MTPRGAGRCRGARRCRGCCHSPLLAMARSWVRKPSCTSARERTACARRWNLGPLHGGWDTTHTAGEGLVPVPGRWQGVGGAQGYSRHAGRGQQQGTSAPVGGGAAGGPIHGGTHPPARRAAQRGAEAGGQSAGGAARGSPPGETRPVQLHPQLEVRAGFRAGGCEVSRGGTGIQLPPPRPAAHPGISRDTHSPGVCPGGGGGAGAMPRMAGEGGGLRGRKGHWGVAGEGRDHPGVHLLPRG